MTRATTDSPACCARNPSSLAAPWPTRSANHYVRSGLRDPERGEEPRKLLPRSRPILRGSRPIGTRSARRPRVSRLDFRRAMMKKIGFCVVRLAKELVSQDTIPRIMILKVARLGFPSLRTAAQPVAVDRSQSPEFQRLIDDMVETMYEYHGVGLAAPQVHLPIQIAVLEVRNHPRYPDMPEVPLTVLINPEVTILDRSTIDEFEGCLSIPDLRGLVPRFKELRVKALGRNGEPLDFTAQDFHARVIQHETDHLKGEVYLDRMPNLRQLGFLDEWQRFMLAKKE